MVQICPVRLGVVQLGAAQLGAAQLRLAFPLVTVPLSGLQSAPNLGAHAPRIQSSATKYFIWAHRCD